MFTNQSVQHSLTEAVVPYSNAREDRLHLNGPDVRLSPRMALALAMALQELVTNAVKYGALSNDAGEIRIQWMLDRTKVPPCLHLRWEESGGPPVQPPKRRGFGTRLIERSLAMDLEGDVEIRFDPSGVVCTVDAPSCRTTRLFRDRSRAAAPDFPCGFGPFRAVGRSRSVLWMIINSEIIPARCPTIPEAIQAAVQMAARTAEGSHGDPGLNPRRVQPRLRPFDPAGYDGSPHLRAACASRGPSETG